MILLSRFQYSPYTSQPIQTFPVHGDIQALNLATENVILRVTSNWGGEYTCLYRVSLIFVVGFRMLMCGGRSVFMGKRQRISGRMQSDALVL
jgi:hypothetical protein